MPEKSTTPDLVELTRRIADALDRRDFEGFISFWTPDGAWEAQPLGIKFDGAVAIRSFVEDWIGSYEEYENEMEEIDNLGDGVVFAVGRQHVRLVGSTATMQERWAYTVVWAEGKIVQLTAYLDVDQARAAAERLVEERG